MIALTRPVPDSLAHCQLTHLDRVPIDLDAARAQHAAYERALGSLGCTIRRVPPAHDHPDSVFVEDVAVVLDELAVITRPGAESRRGETSAVADALAEYRQLEWLLEPATLDGGDVLRLARTLFVGVGSRTNAAGVEQLHAIVAPFGYEVRAVPVEECLHLKSAVTEVAPRLVVLNPDWISREIFRDHRIVAVDPSEPSAANVLRVGETVVCSGSYPRTNARLESAGARTLVVDVSELAKAEGALTCCSVILGDTA